jgi:hypothetical protein
MKFLQCLQWREMIKLEVSEFVQQGILEQTRTAISGGVAAQVFRVLAREDDLRR